MTLSITIIDPWRFYIWKNFPWRGELLAVSWLQNHDVKLEATTLFFADDSLDEISSSSCRCQLTGSRLWHHKESQWRFRILQSSTSITEIRSSREDLRINSELIQSGRQTKILVTNNKHYLDSCFSPVLDFIGASTAGLVFHIRATRLSSPEEFTIRKNITKKM